MDSFRFDECTLIMQSEKYCLDMTEMLNIWKCKEGKCSRCGWNIKEIERRNKLIAEKGLTINGKGLKQFVIPSVIKE